MNVEIKQGIGLPESGKRDTLSEMTTKVISMKINDAFLVVGDKEMASVRASLTTAYQRNNKVQYATRSIGKEKVGEFGGTWEEGVKYYGVWRLPDTDVPRRRKSAKNKGVGGSSVVSEEPSGS